MTRDGEGPFCTPAQPHTVDGVMVLRVFDIRPGGLAIDDGPERAEAILADRDASSRGGE